MTDLEASKPAQPAAITREELKEAIQKATFVTVVNSIGFEPFALDALLARIEADRAATRMAERLECLKIVDRWRDSQHTKLHAGEMNAQEWRTLNAVLVAIVNEMDRALPDGDTP